MNSITIALFILVKDPQLPKPLVIIILVYDYFIYLNIFLNVRMLKILF